MKKSLTTLVIICLFCLKSNLLCQTPFFTEFDGIPILAHFWSSPNYTYQKHNYQDIVDAGIDVAICNSISKNAFDALSPFVKIIPQQYMLDPNRKRIPYYTERAYSEWEAEGNPNYGYQLSHTGIVVGEAVKNCGIAVDTLIQGPRYSQLYSSLLDTAYIFKYAANFRLKIVANPLIPKPEFSIDTNIVCLIFVSTEYNEGVQHYKRLSIDTIRVNEFIKGYNEWNEFKINYNYNNKSMVPQNFLISHYKIDHPNGTKIWKTIPNVQFKVIWLGLNYLDLYVDKVTVFDDEGEKLKNNEFQTYKMINDEINNVFDGFSNPSQIVTWAPLEEPNVIDNLECIKMIDNYLYEQKGVSLYSSLAGSMDGLLQTTPSPIYKVDEFWKRAQYKGLKINNHLFHYPYDENNLTNWKSNIYNMLQNHLNRLNNYDSNFMCSVQTGQWVVDSNHDELRYKPTPAQFKYNINVDLLYGAKGIELNQYYYFYYDNDTTNADTTKRNSLVCVHSDSHNINDETYFTPLWYTLKDEISPRLHGDFGKLLKKLSQKSQSSLEDNSEVQLEDAKFTRISNNCDYDVGIFNDVNFHKYSMVVSRWYNTDTNRIKIEYNNLEQKNFIVKEYYSPKDSIKYVINGKLTIYSTLFSGTSCLFEIKPIVIHGGQLLVDDFVTDNMELIGNLEIPTNKSLKISSNCTYTVSGELYARNGSSICSDHKGDIIFSGSGKYRHETWGSSLFCASHNEHPRLIWGSLQGDQTYGVYRKSGTTYILIATIYSTDNNIKQTYIDSSITIYNGQLAGSEVYYKISRISGGRTYFTNEVSVTISNQSMEKQNTFIKEFAIEQNYPNPFNGITSIKYMIPESGIVRIKIFDILGREIKFFNEGEKEAGMYEFKFNSGELSSGIYIYSVQYNNKILSKKMLLMK